MALHIQTFRTRSITAIVFAAVMLAGLFINEWTFITLFVVVMIGCVIEFSILIRLIDKKRYLYFLPLASLYIILPLLMMLDLGIDIGETEVKPLFPQMDYSPLLPCAVIFSIWINDTMAYIVGSFIGKTPFSKISPKKTWEGTIGGAILCVITIALFSRLINAAEVFHVGHWIMIAIICAIFGTLGDLLESKLKRLAGVKDSGKIMPGHGGFLDRFDSLLIATPVVWIYVNSFM